MKYDLDLTFGEIFNDDSDAFLDQLIDIQNHQANREESEKWVDQLRFIDISNVPDLRKEDDGKWMSYIGESTMMFRGPKKPLILPLLEKKDDDRRADYVAVSWRWTKGKQLPKWGCDVRESFDYMIQRPGEKPHKSKFPDHYFERVILHAQDEDVTRLWIDKECIYQRPGDDPEDLRLGVQIMDVVYGESMFSVGLLTTPLMHQHEVDLLAELLSGAIFHKPNDTNNPRYKRDPRMDTKILQVQTLILRILSDSRWSRGWIFQEDHLASDRMVLMIPHTKRLKTDTSLYAFGAIPGNLKVKLSAFRRAVTMFSMASDENECRWPFSEMLGKAKQYNIFNKKLNNIESNPRKHGIRTWTDGNMGGAKMNRKVHYYNESTYPSTTHSILDDICHRDLEKMEDRVAIMANAARFSKRLDTSSESPLVKSEEYSLSAILLTLILINGEIMKTSDMIRKEDLMNSTLRSLLQDMQYRFSAPLLKYEQSFIDHCRLKGSTISRRGVEAQGFLFKLLLNRRPPAASSKPDPLKLTDGDRKKISRLRVKDPGAENIVPGRKFNRLAEEIILILTSKLRKNYGQRCELADFLEEKLEWDRDPQAPEETQPSTPYVLNMMAGLVQALVDDRELRFAILNGEPDTAQPSAIFIAPFQNDVWVSEYVTSMCDDGTGHSFVFTSWDNGWRNHSMERLASMEVAAFKLEPFEVLSHWDPDQADNSFLRSYSWINGVWKAEGKRMGKYTFPITGLTVPHPRPIEDTLGKRKRDNGDDGDSSADSAVSSGGEDTS
ncbi:hypothetical protein ST47_g6697 [Ascochyta rabiei]|uniref:Heterokaryon incompatibility domain-containing protein n=1 Tax=Didymella rabiei TaxID=5454 RepID=A0A163BZ95_DIDRA|nr:hypothetical protein ST47_g6697 [Ascochyta rabiei]